MSPNDDETSPDGRAPAADGHGPDSRTARVRCRAGLVAAVMLPLLVFGWAALRTPLHFDGAMNLQVAQSLADHGDYSRQYDYVPGESDAVPSPRWECCAADAPPWERFHPYEIQTNGPFIAVATVALLTFGENPLGFGFANLFFLGLLGAVIWALLRRRWCLAAGFVPIVLLLLLPDPFGLALRGFGEIPGLALLTLAILLVVEAQRSEPPRRVALLFTGASFTVGLALITKSFMVGGLAVLVAGWFVVWYLRRPPLRVLALQPLVVLAAPVTFEIYKLVNLGSFSAYRRWWVEQGSAIGLRAGVGSDTETTSPGGGLGRIPLQLDRLADATDLPVALLGVLGLVALGTAALSVRLLWRRDLDDPPVVVDLAIAQVLVTVMMVTYLFWWVLFNPDEFGFDRRSYPIALSLGLSLVLAGAMAGARWADRPERVTGRRALAAAALGTVIVVGLVVDIPSRLDDGLIAETEGWDDEERAAARISRSSPDRQYYGIGFWSAPLLSLLADRPLRNLEETDPCALADDAVLVLDEYALARLGDAPPTLGGAFRYDLIEDLPAAKLYAVSATASGCPENRPADGPEATPGA